MRANKKIFFIAKVFHSFVLFSLHGVVPCRIIIVVAIWFNKKIFYKFIY